MRACWRRRHASPVCMARLPAVWTRVPRNTCPKLLPSLRTTLVIERDITFYSLCEHHLLPFYGKAAIGYIPNGRVAGLSKLARTVEVYARRLQLQEQLCAQVADALMEYLAPQGAIVLMEAEHMCMTMRGVQKPGTKTVTLARRGVFETDPALEERFFRMLGR